MATAIKREKCFRGERMDASMATIVPMPSKALQGTAGRVTTFVKQRSGHDELWSAAQDEIPEGVPDSERPRRAVCLGAECCSAGKPSEYDGKDRREAADDCSVGNGRHDSEAADLTQDMRRCAASANTKPRMHRK